MKIVIAGGREQASFLIASLKRKKHTLVVINEDKEYAQYLSELHDISVINGNPLKKFLLEEAEIENFDVMIALTSNDADNSVICQMAKRFFNIKKVMCIVANPKNVNILKKFGIDIVISATYMMANYIEQATSIENFIQEVSIEDNKVIVFEILVKSDYPCINKTLREIEFPRNTVIGCIINNSNISVPVSSTQIKEGDCLLVITSEESKEKTMREIMGEI